MPDGLSGQFRVQWARKKYFASPFGTRCYSCAFYQCKLHTRPRVQRASGVPRALFGAREFMQGLGRIARRGRKRASRRHCERSEAIHSSFTRQDGLLRFARNDGLLWLFRKLNTSTPHSQSSSPANGSAEWPPCVLPLPSAHEAAGATGIRRSPRPLWARVDARPRAHRAARS